MQIGKQVPPQHKQQKPRHDMAKETHVKKKTHDVVKKPKQDSSQALRGHAVASHAPRTTHTRLWIPPRHPRSSAKASPISPRFCGSVGSYGSAKISIHTGAADLDLAALLSGNRQEARERQYGNRGRIRVLGFPRLRVCSHSDKRRE